MPHKTVRIIRLIIKLVSGHKAIAENRHKSIANFSRCQASVKALKMVEEPGKRSLVVDPLAHLFTHDSAGFQNLGLRFLNLLVEKLDFSTSWAASSAAPRIKNKIDNSSIY